MLSRFHGVLLQRNEARRPGSPDTESPALSTCSNADIFRRMNTMLGNALDFTGVCTTPNTKGKPNLLSGNPSLVFHTVEKLDFGGLDCNKRENIHIRPRCSLNVFKAGLESIRVSEAL